MSRRILTGWKEISNHIERAFALRNVGSRRWACQFIGLR